MPLQRLLLLCGLPSMIWIATPDVQAAQVGIKYNRARYEYPQSVLHDFARFHADRINTVMICLPWTQWEPQEGRLDETFIAQGLAPVLRFCAENGMTVVISNHCCYWGAKGDWSIPRWVRTKPGYKTATSVLTSPEIRRLHIAFLERLIDATSGFSAVVGYNLLNEPVAATQWWLDKARNDFDARWDGVLDICRQVRSHVDAKEIHQYLMIGNAGGDAQLASYEWRNTGKQDLIPLWTRILDKVAAQGTSTLIERGGLNCWSSPGLEDGTGHRYLRAHK